MDNYKLIQPAHLNHYGFLFGGNMLQWVDEYAYINASADFPGQRFVTISLSDLVFRKSVHCGDIILVRTAMAHLGRTSVQYDARVFRATSTTANAPVGEQIFHTRITYVCVDTNGQKIPLPERKE